MTHDDDGALEMHTESRQKPKRFESALTEHGRRAQTNSERHLHGPADHTSTVDVDDSPYLGKVFTDEEEALSGESREKNVIR